MKNWRTTVLGVAIGLGTYLTTVGAKMPTTRQEWWSFAIGLIVAILGAVSRDAWVGLAPTALVLLVLGGCATATPPLSDALANLQAVTVDDLQAALDDATPHGDLAAIQCYNGLIAFVKAAGPPGPKLDPRGRVFYANQLKRDLLLGGTSPNPVLRALHVACAAYVSDEALILARLGVLAAGAAATGGVSVPMTLPVLLR